MGLCARPKGRTRALPSKIAVTRARRISRFFARAPRPCGPDRGAPTMQANASPKPEIAPPCRTCSARFACATSRSPIASAFRRCASIPASTASPTTGISPISRRARSAARRWCSPKRRRSRRRGGSRRRTSASGARSTSSRWSASRASSTGKARSPGFSSPTPAARRAPTGRGRATAPCPRRRAAGAPSGRARSPSASATRRRRN